MNDDDDKNPGENIDRTSQEVSNSDDAANAGSSYGPPDQDQEPPWNNQPRPESIQYPARPNTIQFVQKPKTHVNHTYRDFSAMPNEPVFVYPQAVNQMNFHEKLYHLLTYTTENCHNVIKWAHHGRSFEISSEEALQNLGVLRYYFGYDSTQRFHKQLNDNGYKRLVQDSAKERFYSEFLLRGLPHLLRYSPPAQKRRRLIPDPENEPDFDAISALYPLPGDRRALLAEARYGLQARGFVIYDYVFETVAAGRRV